MNKISENKVKELIKELNGMSSLKDGKRKINYWYNQKNNIVNSDNISTDLIKEFLDVYNKLKKKHHLTKDELIVSRLYKGNYNLSNEEVELLKSMLTSETTYDVDTCDHEIIHISSKNIFTITIDTLGIDLASDGFINIENFMKTRKDLLKIWLNWNYYEDDEMTDDMYMKFLYKA